mgnify:CR=1 FL=1
MPRTKTGWIPASIFTLLSIGILLFAGIDFGFWVPLALALIGWLAVWLIRRVHIRLGRFCWAAVGLGTLWLIGTLTWIGVNHVRSLDRQPPPDCDTIIVLGTGIEDGVPSPHLRMRLDAAIEAAGHYPDTVIIPSGGLDAGQPVTEAQAMAVYMEERGIEPERIILEPRATSTYENLVYSRPLARGDATVVVTSGFHTLRASLWCRWMDWDVVTLGSPTPWNVGVHWWVRECLALWKDIVKHFFVT